MVDSTSQTSATVDSENITAPVVAKARIRSIDTLRGVALLGILLMNIIAFGQPFASYINPIFDGNLEGLNLTTYVVMDVLVEGSMRAIFSMLFGAGLLLFIAKPDADEGLVKTLYYRRTWLLILFGLFNAYVLLWLGDILFAYGVAGLLLYLFRRQSARRLAITAAVIFGLLALLYTAGHIQGRELHREVLAIEALPAEVELTAEQRRTMENWDAYLTQPLFSPESVELDRQIRKSGYVDNFLYLVPLNLLFQTLGLIGGGLWDALAMMLLGMAFMKWGLFDAGRSMRFYAALCILGFGLGLPVNYYEVNAFVNSDFQMYWTPSSRPTYDLGRLLVALGYIGLVMMICKSGILAGLRAALAAVGQTALSNYLLQSVLCNAIFMGWGFNLFGELGRFQLYYVVLGVWVLQLIISPIWLRYFRFGPAEWLWRSLTYRKKQRMRLQAA